MVHEDRIELGEAMALVFVAAGGSQDDPALPLIRQVYSLDMAHIDALAEVEPTRRPVILAGFAEGFDLLLTQSGTGTGHAAAFEEMLIEYGIGPKDMETARKLMGAALKIQFKDLRAADGTPMCKEYGSTDGSRYVLVSARDRAEVLNGLGIGSFDEDTTKFIFDHSKRTLLGEGLAQ